MHVGLTDWPATATAVRFVHDELAERGHAIERFGLCLDRAMGLPPEQRVLARRETGPRLADDEWAHVAALPVQPHLGDHMIGTPASVENAHVALSYTTIAAPIDGRTGIRLVDQGNIVHANDANGLVVITQVQPISAIFTLPQDQLPDVVEAKLKGPLEVTAYSRDGATNICPVSRVSLSCITRGNGRSGLAGACAGVAIGAGGA